MGDATVKGSWGWEMPTYDPSKSLDAGRVFSDTINETEYDDEDAAAAMLDEAAVVAAVSPTITSRRHSLPSISHLPNFSAHKAVIPPPLSSRVLKLQEQVAVFQQEVLELRQEASDLQEYSTAKIARVTRYLGVLAEKAHKLDQAVLQGEAHSSTLRSERIRLFNDLLGVKGNVRVFCRVRPQFEHEGPSTIEFPDDFLIRINASMVGINTGSMAKKEFEFDRVYGPHIGQVDFFQDVQPFVQSALDGFNVCIFAYGQTGSGKTYTMEGPVNNRGIFFRVFEELFDLSNMEMTSTSRFTFSVSMFDLYNEQVRDLLQSSTQTMGSVHMGFTGKSVEVSQGGVENPTDFARVYKMGIQHRGKDALRADMVNRAHLILTVHIYYMNSFSGNNYHSKISMVDLVGSKRLSKDEATGDRLTDFLHINKSLSA